MKVPKSLTVAVIFLILVFSVAWWGVGKIKRVLNKPTPPPPAAIEEQTITTIEGWTVKDIANYLDKEGIVKAELFLEAQANFDRSSFAVLANIPKMHDLEGFLFPDTYRIIKGSTAEQIIAKMVANTERKVATATAQASRKGNRFSIPGYNTLFVNEQEQNGLTAYEVMTLASIVEKEAGGFGSNINAAKLLEERKIVAGIFLNRLSINKALESDATINYFTNSGRARSTGEDLAINSPYNTYKYRGLPPGPIANPSLSSIQAVLNPTETDYLYFFHTQPEGEVVYSKTFEEHRDKKARLLN